MQATRNDVRREQHRYALRIQAARELAQERERRQNSTATLRVTTAEHALSGKLKITHDAEQGIRFVAASNMKNGFDKRFVRETFLYEKRFRVRNVFDEERRMFSTICKILATSW